MHYSLLLSAIAFAPKAIRASPLDFPKHLDIRATEPAAPIYPSKAAGDAPYTNTEAVLRAAIKLPATFTFGQKKAILMTPGTGVTG